MTLLIESPQRDPNSSDSTKEELFLHDRFSLLSNSSYPESSPDMPFQREQRPSLNTFSNDLFIFEMHPLLAISI